MSWIAAITFTPLLAYMLFKPRPPGQEANDPYKSALTQNSELQYSPVLSSERPFKILSSTPFILSWFGLESVKSVNELFIPVGGEVLEINEALADAPELVNNDPYNEGWMIKIKLTAATEVDGLLSAAEYEDFIKAQE